MLRGRSLAREALDWMDSLELPTKHCLVVDRVTYMDDWREDKGSYSDEEKACTSAVHCSLLRWHRRAVCSARRRARCAYGVSLGVQLHRTAGMQRSMRLWKHLHYGKQELAAEMELAQVARGALNGILRVRLLLSLRYWALRARVRVGRKLEVFRLWRRRCFARCVARKVRGRRGSSADADA
jgi:hypothetical protein